MNTKPLRLIFMGTPDFAARGLQALIESHHDVVAVVTNPDRPSGRGKRPKASPVKALAVQHGIDVLQPKSVRKAAVREQLGAYNADVFVVIAYGKILPQRLLDTPRLGCINVHASLLPKLRGAAPINWAIVRQHDASGVCIMRMDAGMDTGPVYARASTPIREGETAGELYDRLATLGAETLLNVLDALSDDPERCPPVAQDHEAATHAPMLTKTDGHIDWALDADAIVARIHGLNPWPGAYTFAPSDDDADDAARGVRIKLHNAKVEAWDDGDANQARGPGQVLVCDPRQGLWIASGQPDQAVAITRAQLPGKRAMAIADMLHGFELPVGAQLVSPAASSPDLPS